MNKLLLLRPVDKIFPISSGLGDRIMNGKIQYHPGIDFAVPIGTAIRAVADGVVVRAGYENPANPKQGFGNRVWTEIRYGPDSFYIWYGHMKEVLVNEHDNFCRGDILGFSGNTGMTTGPHLHLGIRKKDTSIYYDSEFLDT